MEMRWNDFLDRVYGCWLGKCVCGTIGAPYEGYKGNMAVRYTPKLFETALPNDDLDLQVLWLDVIERVGPDFTSADLAEAFYSKCPYSPGEYATFRKNYALGLLPPLTGKFNNNYYIEGMGCPIRSEIWACMAPGDPALAASLAAKDGCLDHAGESVTAEQYMAALESMAFTGGQDLRALVIGALAYIDPDARFSKMVQKIDAWCAQNPDRDDVYGRILRDYGHPDCTNMFQNMGIVIMALLLGGGDLVETTMLALNCGFDTDCTCATVGAFLGILLGGETAMRRYNLPEQHFKLGVNLTRRSDLVYDLAVDTARAAMLFLDRNRALCIPDAPLAEMPRPVSRPRFPVSCAVSYGSAGPCIRPGESREITVTLTRAPGCAPCGGTVRVQAPEGFAVTPATRRFEAEETQPTCTFAVTLRGDVPVVTEQNLLTCAVTSDDGAQQEMQFGLVGASIWTVYGPFWENTTYAPPPKALESYFAHLGGGRTESESLTILRQFHLNMKADIQKPYLEAHLLEGAPLSDAQATDPACRGFTVCLTEDRFTVSEIMENTMPCVLYMVRDVYAPRDMTVCLQIGRSDAFRLWKDGELLASGDGVEHWTPENVHCKSIRLHAGSNRFVLKLARTAGDGAYSVMFTEGGACTAFLTELGSVNPACPS